MVVGATTDPAVRAVDERARRVYFTANLPSPVERQLFWVSLDAPGEPQRVTVSAGTHGIAMSMDGTGVRRHVLERQHAAARHPATRQRRGAHGAGGERARMPRIRTAASPTNT